MISARFVTFTVFLVPVAFGTAVAQTRSGSCADPSSTAYPPGCRPGVSAAQEAASANRRRPLDFEASRKAWRESGEQWRRQRERAQQKLDKLQKNTPEAKLEELDESVLDYYKSVPGAAKRAIGKDADKVKAGKTIMEKGGKMVDAYGGVLGAASDLPENQRATAELERRLRSLDYNITFSERMLNDIEAEWRRSNEWTMPPWLREQLRQVIEQQQRENRRPSPTPTPAPQGSIGIPHIPRGCYKNEADYYAADISKAYLVTTDANGNQTCSSTPYPRQF